MFHYDHYVTLRLREPWRVPILLGHMPAKPHGDSSAAARGRHALFMMHLLRAWRRPSDLVAWLGGREVLPESVDDCWERVHVEYARWFRDEIEAVAGPYYSRVRAHGPAPQLDTRDW